MNKRTITIATIIIILIAVLAPIGINGLLTKEKIAEYSIAGESKDWLSFYGSYLGGIFTAYISFIILSFTIRNNKVESKREVARQHLIELRTDLSRRVSALNFSRIGIVSLVMSNDFSRQEENLKLDNFHQELTRDINSFNLIYGTAKEPYIIEFKNSYNACILAMFDDITDMTKLIAQIPNKVSDYRKSVLHQVLNSYLQAKKASDFSWNANTELEMNNLQEEYSSILTRENIVDQINSIISRLGEHKNKYANDVFAKAESWLKEEQIKLNKIM